LRSAGLLQLVDLAAERLDLATLLLDGLLEVLLHLLQLFLQLFQLIRLLGGQRNHPQHAHRAYSRKNRKFHGLLRVERKRRTSARTIHCKRTETTNEETDESGRWSAAGREAMIEGRRNRRF